MLRLRDLDRAGRALALLLGLALVLAPVRAAAVEAGRWSPQGDDALIELRARDVGTARTPLVGQPSTSGAYGGDDAHVAHPGPAGLFVLAPGIRLLGPTAGILVTTAAVSAICALVVAWTVLRRAGLRAAAVASTLLALAMWTAGGAGLVDPLSSNLGRLPLVAAAVLVWALACGDRRLAPLAVAVTSFAAQQHLSVLPAAAVVAAVGGLALVVPFARARVGPRWTGLAAAVGLVAWSPVLVQQLRGDPGNLGALARYSGDGERVDLGLRSAAGQVARVLATPFLGRSGVDGWDLVDPPGAAVVAAAVVVAGALAAGGWWARHRAPDLSRLVLVAGALAVAGVLTGMNVPDSPEQGRLNFFHWAFALSLVELLALAWLAVEVARARAARVSPRAVGAAAVVAVTVLALLPLGLDRSSDRLLQAVPRSSVRTLVDAVRADPEVAADRGPLLSLVAGEDRFVQLGDTVPVRLRAAGLDVRFGPGATGFVHPDHQIDPCAVDRALVVALGLGAPRADVPGRRVAAVVAVPGVDLAALDRLAAQAEGQRVELGPDLAAALARRPGDQGDLLAAQLSYRLGTDALDVLRTRSTVELLRDHPPAAPALDADDLAALAASFPHGVTALPATHLSVHLLDRAQLARFRPDLVAGCR